jgi:hypothetical protein
MSRYALTDIKHGNEDGTVTEIQQSEEVDGKLPDDVLDELEALGSVGPLPVFNDNRDIEKFNAAKDARIKALEDALAQAQARAGMTEDAEETRRQAEQQRAVVDPQKPNADPVKGAATTEVGTNRTPALPTDRTAKDVPPPSADEPAPAPNRGNTISEEPKARGEVPKNK